MKVPELFPKLQVEWNSRFTRRMGDAEWKKLKGTGIVRFSLPLWPRATPEERRNTVIHEVCHIVANYKYQLWRNPGRRNPHGKEWAYCMRQCGQNPARCHKVDRTGLKRNHTRTKYKVHCDCKEWLIGPARMRRITRGTTDYQCPYCKTKVRQYE